MNIINHFTTISLINNGNCGNQILFLQGLSLFVLILLLLLLTFTELILKSLFVMPPNPTDELNDKLD